MRRGRIGALITSTGVGIVFLLFQARTIFGGDAGDLVSAVCTRGVAHPPGYPLYVLLGRLLLGLPLYSPAWRVSLLSSLPAAVTTGFIFWLVYKLTGSFLTALISGFILAFNYPFWLYAEVPEVFSLNNLFLSVLLFLCFDLINKIEEKKLFLFFFIAGLSLSHHHFSFWFYPVFFLFLFLYQKKYWLTKPSRLLKFIICFFLGLLPYLYVFIAARSYPSISWDSPVNFRNFWRLVSRADYGTFLSHGGAIMSGLRDRLVLVWGFFLVLKEHLSSLGIFLLILGLIFIYNKKRKYFWLLFSLLIWELFFLFYSGFNLSSKSTFGIGIYFRFLLPGVVFSVVLIGIGIFFFAQKASDFLINFLNLKNISQKTLSFLVILVFLFYPFSLFLKNVRIFKELKNDFTAENFAEDILNTAPENSILLLSFDNPLFNSQYLHYCLGKRKDLTILHLSLFEKDFFYPNLLKNYPQLIWPSKEEEDFLKKFLELNFPSRNIYTNNIRYFKVGAFIPSGLLYQYYPSKEKIPSVDEVYEVNKNIWENYHDPLNGILSFFRPSPLSAVLDNYCDSAKRLATFLFGTGKRKESKEFFEKAIYFNSKDEESLIYLGKIFMEEKNCLEAQKWFLKAAIIHPKASLPYFYLRENAANCLRDSEKEKIFNEIYLKNKELEGGKIPYF